MKKEIKEGTYVYYKGKKLNASIFNKRELSKVVLRNPHTGYRSLYCFYLGENQHRLIPHKHINIGNLFIELYDDHSIILYAPKIVFTRSEDFTRISNTFESNKMLDIIAFCSRFYKNRANKVETISDLLDVIEHYFKVIERYVRIATVLIERKMAHEKKREALVVTLIQTYKSKQL